MSTPHTEAASVRRIAVLSDVHADVHALRDSLIHIDALRCDAIVCLGDVVDFGLFPEETIDELRALRIPTIRGNHDRWAIGRGSAASPHGSTDSDPFDAHGWGLSDESLAFLAELPASWRVDFDGLTVVGVHASPGNDMAGIYPNELPLADAERVLDAVGAHVLFVGHTHAPFVATLPDGRLLANPGALLRDPFDRDLVQAEHGLIRRGAAVSWGTFAVLELPARSLRVYNASDGSEHDLGATRLRA